MDTLQQRAMRTSMVRAVSGGDKANAPGNIKWDRNRTETLKTKKTDRTAYASQLPRQTYQVPINGTN